jgi:Rrf2 family protein
MQISKKSQYGLRAMVFLAKNFKVKKIASLKDVSKAETIPFDFLEKIISKLEKSGLLKSRRGVSGGYILAKSPRKITIEDIVNPLENTTAVDCSLCGKTRKCLTRNVWRKIDVAISKTLKSITLADLIK